MNRAIRLTRIHAINWYGYNDTLDVAGNLLIAGVTGSGKSVLMDLIQLALVGSDRALFNRSATGSTSDRTLRSYVLCDTKREENGQPQYVRDRGAIAFVALEFTWPRGDRIETWGLRLEFRNASETQGRVTPFWCDGRIEKADFLDAERCPLDLPAFRHRIEKEKDGRLFETQEQYLRDMANESHLNFNRSVLSTLLPTSMSFTNLKSFDEFCRRFILPGESLNVADVTSSYKNFLAYERDLRDLNDQFQKLNNIRDLFTEHSDASRDRVVARWLAAKLALEHSTDLSSTHRSRLDLLNADYAAEFARLTQLEFQIDKLKTDLKQTQAAIYQLPGGADYVTIKARLKTLTGEIERFKEIGTTLESAVRARVRHARSWLIQAHSIPLPSPLDLTTLNHATQRLESCALNQTDTALRTLAEAVETTKQEINRITRPTRERLEGLRSTLGALREEITMLEHGIPPGPRLLLNALNEALPRQGHDLPARQLRDLCEVTDERWRAAIEVAFNRKFAVVVAEDHYDQALRIYHALRAECPQESLVHPIKALRLQRPAQPGSLAEKIQADHPIARALVDHLFGHLICVERHEDLAQHDAAILPDGFMTRGVFAERRAHYNNLPFVGRRGLEQQLAVKRSHARDLETEERRLKPIVDAAESLTRAAVAAFPEYSSLVVDLARASELPSREAERDQLLAHLNTIDRASFDEKEQQARVLEAELAARELEYRELNRSQKPGEIKTLEAALAKATAEESRKRERFERVQSELGDISPHAAHLNRWRTEIQRQFPATDAAADRFEKLEADARETIARVWGSLVAARRELALVHRKFEDLSPEDPSNLMWDKLRDQIAEANIPDYQAKSKAARAQWEGLFRSQILSKLDRALRDLRNTIALLNGNLRSPIGNDRYEIETRPSPEFKVYRDLINLNAQSYQDELFFASVDGELRDALDRFLTVLVEQPDSAEAARLLDYRHYFDYDLLVWDTRDPQAKSVSVDRQSGKFSGGENQSPYFVAILASYLRAYNRHETRWAEPSLAVVPIDEAFSKLSPERIEDCVRALKQLQLQGVLSMSAGNIPFAFSQCDQVIIVSKHEERHGSKSSIRNVAVSLLRDTEEGREWMDRHR